MVQKGKSPATGKLTHYLVKGAGWIPVVNVIDDGEPNTGGRSDYHDITFETDNGQVIIVERDAIVARKYNGRPA